MWGALLLDAASEAVVTKEQLTPFLYDIAATLGAITAVCISVFAIILSVRLIEPLLKMFLGGGSVAPDGEDYDDWPPSPEDWDWNIDPPSWLEEQWMEEGAWGDLDD